ncbi:MAG: hypothetical protein FJX77_17975, partial [Armatimonadetes bacterium]|nr:hypothetical protein [Armatimonadota bacterium]
MIGDGPRLIESLSGPLHEALQATLEAGEEIRIAVRSYPREAVAVTNRRLLLVREGKPVQALPLAALRKVRSEVQPGGGSLLWETEHPGLPNSVGFPPYDGAKFGQVAARIRRWSAEEE